MTFCSLEILVPTSMYFRSIDRYLLFRNASLNPASELIEITYHNLYATNAVARTLVASDSPVAATPYKPSYRYPAPVAGLSCVPLEHDERVSTTPTASQFAKKGAVSSNATHSECRSIPNVASGRTTQRTRIGQLPRHNLHALHHTMASPKNICGFSQYLRARPYGGTDSYGATHVDGQGDSPTTKARP